MTVIESKTRKPPATLEESASAKHFNDTGLTLEQIREHLTNTDVCEVYRDATCVKVD
jgi:hypothetical protein